MWPWDESIKKHFNTKIVVVDLYVVIPPWSLIWLPHLHGDDPGLLKAMPTQQSHQAGKTLEYSLSSRLCQKSEDQHSKVQRGPSPSSWSSGDEVIKATMKIVTGWNKNNLQYWEGGAACTISAHVIVYINILSKSYLVSYKQDQGIRNNQFEWNENFPSLPLPFFLGLPFFWGSLWEP